MPRLDDRYDDVHELLRIHWLDDVVEKTVLDKVAIPPLALLERVPGLMPCCGDLLERCVLTIVDTYRRMFVHLTLVLAEARILQLERVVQSYRSRPPFEPGACFAKVRRFTTTRPLLTTSSGS